MSLLRNAIKLTVLPRTSNPSHGLPSLLCGSLKHLSTETEAFASPPPPPANDASIDPPPPNDPFLRISDTGLVYGRLSGIARHTLKSDILNLLEGCHLTPDNVKVNYTRNFMPVAVLVQFPSVRDFDNAFRLNARKGRLYKLERVERYDWDIVMPYNGKTVFLQNIPRSAVIEDIERFLSGCEYEGSSIDLFLRQGLPDNLKLGTVRFPSQTLAMNAFITKNKTFCLNNQISMRVLQ